MERKKVCITTWYTSINYGTCLQCFALSDFLQRKGYDTSVPVTYKYYYEQHPLLLLQKILRKLHQRSNRIPIEYINRRRNNDKFSDRNENLVNFRSIKEFNKFVKTQDVFIAGSDQIWNPTVLEEPFLLSYTSGKKIAYASSLGVSKLPKNKVKIYKKYLSRFSWIGVREETAKQLLEPVVPNVKIDTVLDPTFLLSEEDWKRVCSPSESEKYIFCYFIGENQSKYSGLIKRIAEKEHLQIITLVSENMFKPDFGVTIVDAGADEFLSYINSAHYVFTDSFHCTALSINLHKNFVVFKRFADSDQASQNSRLIDLLSLFHLNERLSYSLDCSYVQSILEHPINYGITSKRLELLRAQSIKKLIDAIEK